MEDEEVEEDCGKTGIGKNQRRPYFIYDIMDEDIKEEEEDDEDDDFSGGNREEVACEEEIGVRVLQSQASGCQ
ncbi:hypothetical protein NL676_018202 [Syzygium grande]|nr:hypothetical protein NL676_018202 [Syzygium grande]